ncbi:PREDICTED: plexin-A3-like, partial [Priapulus caudatus]|uniref:Plexin-A3-like n=1 Tax=Priapulus caudatus TaxID=37621 RepID=A0ABM1F0M9_PRICU
LALDSGEKATEYAEVPVDEGSAVNSDFIIDAANEYLYVMTEHKLSKLRVETCEQYADCGQCVGSGDAHCGWCYSDINPRCTPRRECNTDWVYYRTGDCMLIKDVLPHSLQVTKKKTLTIHVENLRAHTAELQCVFYAGATYVLTAANRTAVDTIQCSTPDTRRLKAIPIPPVGRVSVYKCEKMGRQCGECLRTDAMYACGWCGGATCSTEKQCRPADWFSLSNDTICPNPTITSFSPSSGPIEGGTVVVIDGYNLGLAFDDVDPYVTVGASACDCGAHRDAYIPARRVVCTVGRSRGGVTRGHVRVAVRGDSRHVAESREQYAYVDPEVATVRPRRGPMSGGTTLTVEGRHLDAGSRVAVTLGGAAIGDAAGGVADSTGGATVSLGGAGSACEVVARNATHVVCVTAAAEVAGAATLTVTLDGASRGGGGGGGEELAFVYTDDPVVNATESAVSGREPGGVPSGGLEVFVRGENLDVVQHPQLLVAIDDEEYSHPCVVANDTMMTCKTPTFPQSKAPSGDKPRAVDYGFIMDGVTSLRNLSAVQFGKFHLYPDPVVHNFSEDGRIKLYKTDYLAISIDNACEICNRADFFEVRIGRRVCNVTSVAPNLINCVPPGEQPEPVAPPVGATRRDKRKHLPEVIVIVGGTRRYVIGYLEYDTERPVLPLWAAAAISGVGLALIVAIVVVVVKYCRKKRESKKVVRGMQQQMDQLELKVAAECKEGEEVRQG